MKILGIHLAKSQLCYAVLEGTKTDPNLLDKGRLVTTDPDDIPRLMDWFDTQFRTLLNKHNPEKIAYRLTLNPSKLQLATSELPLGILNLHAYQKALPIKGYTPQSFVASKLGLPKGSDVFAHCDAVFGPRPPYWDKNQKCAILVAWFELA